MADPGVGIFKFSETDLPANALGYEVPKVKNKISKTFDGLFK
jgi:hypothetical protein